MYRIVRREVVSPQSFLWEVEAPDVARAAQPGQFIILRLHEQGERIPLTIADFDRERGTITLVVQVVGKTTKQMMEIEEGSACLDFAGPLGLPSEVERFGTVVLVGGGLGVAPVYPQLRAIKQAGNRTISIIGFRNKDLVFWEERFREFSDELHVATDDGSYGTKGFVTALLQEVLEKSDPRPERCIAVGPMVMMKACCDVTRPFEIPTIVSLNSIMVDGTGMCGSCRVTVGGKMRFACVDGPDFDGHEVDFEELMHRQVRYRREESESLELYNLAVAQGEDPTLAVRQSLQSREAGAAARPAKALDAQPQSPAARKLMALLQEDASRETEAAGRKKISEIPCEKAPMPERDPHERARSFKEVALGYDVDAALIEASRCIQCPKPRCVAGCPVSIDIPAFIKALTNRNLRESYRILKDANALPAVCGRVCPQEVQCEAECVLGKKMQPVAIGRLERFVADAAMGRDWDEIREITPTGKKVAIIGSGPAGLTCAADLAKAGVAVTIFEALHDAGGVLRYGIPDFRLPTDIIDYEISGLRKLGVEIRTNAVIGTTFTIPQLMEEMGYDTVFIGVGAGAPSFLRIPGEALNGVFSANEYLTRCNLMKGYLHPQYDTPVGAGKRVAVIGAGNTAMDSARVSLRMGADEVIVVYRRSRAEAPARIEELEHAIEEGIKFHWLTAPVKIIGDERGWATGMECIEMKLGEPDASGRRRPLPKEGTNFVIPCDTVVNALGNQANPMIPQTTPGLETNKWGYISVDEETQMTSIPGVFAGGDIVTGGATVILAMGAGRQASAGMLRFMGLGS
ncbi:MAG: NADPH-dependent glutamate synthase [Candidatus Eisenbacteria sp.]|nr:NADPH-dependent glutamate synthase [Candidatus Eisenbacteria bacterium]